MKKILIVSATTFAATSAYCGDASQTCRCTRTARRNCRNIFARAIRRRRIASSAGWLGETCCPPRRTGSSTPCSLHWLQAGCSPPSRMSTQAGCRPRSAFASACSTTLIGLRPRPSSGAICRRRSSTVAGARSRKPFPPVRRLGSADFRRREAKLHFHKSNRPRHFRASRSVA